MTKKLIAYFSVSGVTKKVAEALAAADGADLFEIAPVEPYTAADIDYTNKQSRSTLEMTDLNSRPAVCCKVENMDQYDTVFIGFPVWWGREPSIVDTFIDENCLSGKVVVPFCTSGGSDASGSTARIRELAKGATVIDGIRMAGDISPEELMIWEAGLKL